ncbi:MAG: selenide, water dikinase SelD [Pseudomonadota bacterium]
MNSDLPLTRDLVFVGGGHSHALVLRRWGMDPLPGARLTLINPGPTAPYTGMLPGHVAGHYDRDALDIDLVRLARFARARWIDGAVTGLDAQAGLLRLACGREVAYDVASIDVGITSEMPSLPGFAEHGVPAKPLGTFAMRWRAYLADVAAGSALPEAAVIGGGVAGAELAMAIAHALGGVADAPRVAVIEAQAALTGMSVKARDILMARMTTLGITLHAPARVARLEADTVVLDDGATVPSAFTVGAAGARPHDWLAETGLPLEDGFLRVDPTLQVEGHPALFATGDCAHMVHAPRPKAGVFAVRAAPVLHANLRAALSGGRLRPFRPQRRYLKLISLGAKDAVGERGDLTLSGPWLWRWKDRIDRGFMDKFTDLPNMAVPAPPRVAALDAVADAPLCAGCGSKVGVAALGNALAGLPTVIRADVASTPGDDAAVLEMDGVRQVLTNDHLRAFVADPVLFARITTVHALGDIWAMGATPQAGLATVILPRMSEDLQRRTMAEVLGTVSDVLRAAGAELVGGHSLMGAEMSLGLSLTGLAAGDPIGLSGAEPGDALILTKPLGSGTLLAAEMAGRARGGDVVELLRAMAQPQGAAAAILAGAKAMTDVTGFGLAGHLQAICAASGVGAELSLADLPLYAGAEALAAAGIRSTLHPSNLAAAPVAGAAGARGALLHDPQTAGGLLAAVSAGEADTLCHRLREDGSIAAIIGRIVAQPGLRCV